MTCTFLWRIYTCNFNPIHEFKQKLRERKLKISYFFSKFKRDKSVKINEPLPNSNFTCVFLWHIYTCNFNLIHTSELKFRAETENFFKRDNSVINHQTMTKFKFDLRNPITYPYIKCVQTLTEIMSGNWKFLFFFCSRGITLSKPADQNQIRTRPAHSYDEPTHAIWIL